MKKLSDKQKKFTGLEKIVLNQMIAERLEMFKPGVQLKIQDRTFKDIDEVVFFITDSMWSDFNNSLYQIDEIDITTTTKEVI